MSIFRCTKCGCIENTATSHYWSKWPRSTAPLCSECDPEIGRWHGRFPKSSAAGYHIGADGFLYHPEAVAMGQVRHTKIVGKVPGELVEVDTRDPMLPPELLEEGD